MGNIQIINGNKNHSKIIWNMILFIINNNPKPSQQIGEIHHFKRLSIKDNELLIDMSLEDIYDGIRMVDA